MEKKKRTILKKEKDLLAPSPLIPRGLRCLVLSFYVAL